MIERLHLKNFSVFDDLPLELSPKINVIIGENGTGKTQLLKALYFANKSLAHQEAGTDELLRLYRPLHGSLKGLVGNDGKSRAEIFCQMANGQELNLHFSSTSRKLAQERFVSTPVVGAPNFIPVKEVLSLMRGMLSKKCDSDTLETLFDQSYMDIAEKLAKPSTGNSSEKIDADPRFAEVYLKLVELLGGKFDVVNTSAACYVGFQSGHYKIVQDPKSPSHGAMTFRSTRRDSADMTAEGLRKLGTLQLLLENHELDPGRSGIFLWDEPESNLNPKLMEQVVKTLIELSRNGQQLVVATHDYVLLKWFSLVMNKGKDDHVRFHSLYRVNQSNQIKIVSTDSYLDIEKNPIAEAFNNLTVAYAKSRLEGGYK